MDLVSAVLGHLSAVEIQKKERNRKIGLCVVNL